ncbi:MAG TPA: hypothetical protein VN709_04670 [Terriglobales bacterium]|nr:hypothetical protein [Terriglobales bacterium]
MEELKPTLMARARNSYAYRGAWRTLRLGAKLARYHLRHGWRAPRPHGFDLEYGTETVAKAALAGEPEAARRHEPIDTVQFATMMGTLASRPGFDFSEFTFIDLGAGRGRAMMLAAQYSFREIVGVEYSRELHAAALVNFGVYEGRYRLGCVHADMLEWALPTVPAVFYFFEPFLDRGGMQRLADRVRASLRSAPRPVYVVYAGDWFRSSWEEAGDFTAIGPTNNWFQCYRWVEGT